MNMSTLRPSRRALQRQRGFSLIEVLIGLLIAMIGVVIMMQVLITAEERNRTTSTGNEALSNGAVMMHMLQRDLVQAGYGINALPLMGCSLTLPSGNTIPLAPVVVNPASSVIPTAGTDPNTDRILVFYGNGNGQPEGNEVLGAAGSKYTVQSPVSFARNDYVVAYPTSCAAALTLARVSNDADAVDLGTGEVKMNTPVVATASMLFNMGQAPRIVGYAVRGGSLTSCDFLTSNCANGASWAAVAGGIVSLRAQYGHEGSPMTWDQSTPTSAGSCDWVRINATRYVLVARSTQYESKFDSATGQRTGDQVTAAAPTWAGSADKAIDLSGDGDWQFYRYRTFENIAPARNVIWMKGSSGC